MAQAVLVTFLWSTSWVPIKFGLRENLPPLTFAGLRYSLAFACLAPLLLANRSLRMELGGLTRGHWLELALLGVVYYAVTQGAQFLSLVHLPAAMAGLVLNLIPLLVAIIGMITLHEHPTARQWSGLTLCLAGVALYFMPAAMSAAHLTGILAASVSLLANASGSVLGRAINRRTHLSAVLVTLTSMGIGAALLLAVGLATQGWGAITGRAWFLIAWLALVNTAFAFTLWNQSLHMLSAVESSAINGLMLPQIALLAWLFIGETLAWREIAGLMLVGAGTVVVQLRR